MNGKKRLRRKTTLHINERKNGRVCIRNGRVEAVTSAGRCVNGRGEARDKQIGTKFLRDLSSYKKAGAAVAEIVPAKM